MARRPGEGQGTYQKRLLRKKDRCDWAKFNFLENLLVFRVLKDHRVPAESGVRFRISRKQQDAGLCLLIRIDHKEDPIFTAGEIRPDYLVLHMSGAACICTIVEMKGKSQPDLKHGIQQIEALARRLKKEFSDHLPGRFRMHIQGILLAPYNAQIPLALIAKTARNELTILPISFSDRAELYPYISKLNRVNERFKNRNRSPREFTRMERILAECAFQERIDEGRAGASPTGIHIDYILSEHDEYVSLMVRDNRAVFVVKENGDLHTDQIRQEITSNGLDTKFQVERS